jgi:hypothetical protein
LGGEKSGKKEGGVAKEGGDVVKMRKTVAKSANLLAKKIHHLFTPPASPWLIHYLITKRD